jgi:hypothetical protein
MVQDTTELDYTFQELASRHGKAARQARLSLSFGKVRLLPPRHSSKKAPLTIWIVRVWEQTQPQGEEGLEWVLLTSVAVSTLKEA